MWVVITLFGRITVVSKKGESGVIREALVNSPLSHGKYLHGTGEGHVTISRKIPSRTYSHSNWEQHSYTTRELYEILSAYGGVYDAYISQNRFYGPRAVSRLAQLSAMYADIDYYNIAHLNGMHPRSVMDLAFEDLQRARIPRPSLVIATGRGLALVWRHEPVPRNALPKWKVCQDYIFEALRGLGADPSAMDAARVLRLVGSRNLKTGTTVEALWEDYKESTWGFGDLADEILPLTREELEKLRAQRRESAEKRASKAPRKASKARENVESRFNRIYPRSKSSSRLAAHPKNAGTRQAAPGPAQRLDVRRRNLVGLPGRAAGFGA